MNTRRDQPYKLESKFPFPIPSLRKDKADEDKGMVTKSDALLFTSKKNIVIKEEPGSIRQLGQDVIPTSSYKESSRAFLQTEAAAFHPSSQDGDLGLSFIMETPPSVFFSLEFINEQILEQDTLFKNIPVGGLSALTYHPEKKHFLALSDAKGNRRGPPRFYKLKLNKKEEGKKYELELIDQVLLQNKIGKPFKPIDPEGISFFKSDYIFISSEGVQLPYLMEPPGVFVFDSQGKWSSSWPLPDIYWTDDPSRRDIWGVKENKAFEALTINHEQNQLWLATESSLHQDDLIEVDASDKQYIRISRFDVEMAQMTGQFIYEMDSYIEINNFTGHNGLTDFFSVGDAKFLVVERTYLKNNSISGDRKTDNNLVRLFLTDCSRASDISHYKKLNKGRIVTCGKKLVADLSAALGDVVDNIEGITIGPEVSKGQYLLVLVSDNNFSRKQKTQFLFFHYSL
ncbi:MAG: esterase-like activity of phytase family protein [Bdellovibrionales bacterium]|nr:esterase-like activity of phytase family protein [Bdellovibrionales bacterium]